MSTAVDRYDQIMAEMKPESVKEILAIAICR